MGQATNNAAPVECKVSPVPKYSPGDRNTLSHFYMLSSFLFPYRGLGESAMLFAG